MRYPKLLATTALCAVFATAAYAEDFNIPQGDLKAALDAYASQSGIPIMVSAVAISGVRTPGVKGTMPSSVALTRILSGTGFVAQHHSLGAVSITRAGPVSPDRAPIELADAVPAHVSASVETVVVTSSKIKGDIQTVPIAITALSQEQLTSRQIAGGPDLVKEVPNLTFSKTNFTGYNIQIRGIGTQAISVTTDPAVAVAFNDIPFIRNHFFEQEFYDVSQVEVLRGPQGTLYGRNATAGVVNLISAKPTDQFEAMLSADWGNYQNRRYEGMVNIPIVDDRADLRIAGEWTKREGYTINGLTGSNVDGRDLWSSRVTLGLKPTEDLQMYVVWEHFQENDDRMRTAKQLCKRADPPTTIAGVPVPVIDPGARAGALTLDDIYFSQSCQMTSLYSADAFQVPYGQSLPYVVAIQAESVASAGFDPYSTATQSRNLRTIETALNPQYKAKNDTVELNAEYSVTPSIRLISQTGFGQDFLSSTEDYNRFNTRPGIFNFPNPVLISPDSPVWQGRFTPDPQLQGANIWCDPQLGCSDRLVAQDLSDERAWQLSQEFRLTSNFTGPFNFSVGANYLHYETEENYYVFINALSIFSYISGSQTGTTGGGISGIPGVQNCLYQDRFRGGFQNPNPIAGGGFPTYTCIYVDPNPIGSLNNEGHNYFLSQNPYTLNSYAGFGEAYYDLTSNLKLTGGIRWTEDRKHFVDLPSEVITYGYGYYTTDIVNQRWGEITGRTVVNWTPKLDFTDQTLIYGSFSHGYKAGGANPPGPVFDILGSLDVAFPVHPLTFKPEFINAYELGTKNTLLDGALTFNAAAFYYDYTNYQISEIVDRTSINLNFNAKVKGAEIESSWEPAPGLRFNFAGGWEDTRVDDGQYAIDLMDRTAGTPGWMVLKPNITQSSNCIMPDYVVAALIYENTHRTDGIETGGGVGTNACAVAYNSLLDPVSALPYSPNPTGLSNPNNDSKLGIPASIPAGYPGFDPTQPAINDGEGFAKPLGGNKLPNAPPFTVSAGGQYTMPLSEDWAGTLRADYYWQDNSWARVINDNPYDRLRGYTNVNLALILTSQTGWQVMLYDKNVFDTTAITSAFLNSDDSGLTTNVFLTDPRLFGVRVTKNW